MCSRLKSSTQVIKDTGFTLQVALLHVTLVHPRIDNKDMEFAFTEEQEAFRDSVKRFAEEKSTSEDVRRLMETEEGYDESTLGHPFNRVSSYRINYSRGIWRLWFWSHRTRHRNGAIWQNANLRAVF